MAPERTWISAKGLIEYWRTISYDLTPKHLQGLRAFYAYAAELSLIDNVPEIAVLDAERSTG